MKRKQAAADDGLEKWITGQFQIILCQFMTLFISAADASDSRIIQEDRWGSFNSLNAQSNQVEFNLN